MIDALFGLFARFYEGGDFVSAERVALNIMRAVPDDAVAVHLLGLVLYRTGRRDDALRAFVVADRAARALDRIHPAERPLSASLQCLRAACRSGSELAGAWYHLGLVQFRLRRYPQAIRALHAAASAQSDAPAAARRAMARVARRRRSDFVGGWYAVATTERASESAVDVARG
ncbi:MAG: hypothetical protein FAZ92_03476 [Accumulibacter sp.]|uniref:hypothetical protein n=1 Tax=Accumulibacter sp. TaxID=2053492 RepID=UPI0012224B09|nr:hypothetical protein [Accumulibacter sp.]TLD44269.1 MAG: hypothetical protein FAZ92_03476 [Accumulibacter sp.]